MFNEDVGAKVVVGYPLISDKPNAWIGRVHRPRRRKPGHDARGLLSRRQIPHHQSVEQRPPKRIPSNPPSGVAQRLGISTSDIAMRSGALAAAG
jgi:hypothetical protein